MITEVRAEPMIRRKRDKEVAEVEYRRSGVSGSGGRDRLHKCVETAAAYLKSLLNQTFM